MNKFRSINGINVGLYVYKFKFNGIFVTQKYLKCILMLSHGNLQQSLYRCVCLKLYICIISKIKYKFYSCIRSLLNIKVQLKVNGLIKYLLHIIYLYCHNISLYYEPRCVSLKMYAFSKIAFKHITDKTNNKFHRYN